MSAALKKSAYHVRQILQQLDDRRSPEHKECRHYVIGRPVEFRSLMPMAPECIHCVIGRPIEFCRRATDNDTGNPAEWRREHKVRRHHRNRYWRSGRMEKRASGPMSAALTVQESRVRQTVMTTGTKSRKARRAGKMPPCGPGDSQWSALNFLSNKPLTDCEPK